MFFVLFVVNNSFILYRNKSRKAAEALGAIGDSSSLDILEEYLNDEHVVVRETCELSIAKIKFENDNGKQDIPKRLE